MLVDALPQGYSLLHFQLLHKDNVLPFVFDSALQDMSIYNGCYSLGGYDSE